MSDKTTGLHRILFGCLVATVLSLTVNPVGMAEPWMSMLLDTGSPSTDDTGAASPSADTGSGSVDTGGGGDDTGSSGDDTGGSSDDTGVASDDTGVASDDTGVASDDTGSSPEDTSAGPDDTAAPSDDTGSADDTATPSDDTGSTDDTGVSSDDTASVGPADTGAIGKSAAELAGEKGGCGCSATPRWQAGIGWILIGLFGLCRRRRTQV